MELAASPLKRRLWRKKRSGDGAAVEIVRRSKPKTISGTARVPWTVTRATQLNRCRNDGIGRRAGLKRRQLPLSSTRIHERKSLEEPSYFGNLKRLSFFEGASVADRLTRESIRTHFPTQKAPMPVWWNWQTPWIQNPVSARTCGFDPRHRHHPGIPKALFYGGFRDFHIQFRR